MWHRNTSAHLGIVPVALLLFAAACKSDDSTNSTPPVATTIVANTGSDAQTGTVGTALANVISVHVADADGNSFANGAVTWTVNAGNGSTDSTTTHTDASGNAIVTWTLGTAAKKDTLLAAIANGTVITITATAQAGAAAQIAVVSGDAQSVTAGTATAPLVVKVTDQYGNAVSNATVTWVSVGGTLSAATGTTDATGQSQVTLTTDVVAADYTITATVGATIIATFTAHGT